MIPIATSPSHISQIEQACRKHSGPDGCGSRSSGKYCNYDHVSDPNYDPDDYKGRYNETPQNIVGYCDDCENCADGNSINGTCRFC